MQITLGDLKNINLKEVTVDILREITQLDFSPITNLDRENLDLELEKLSSEYNIIGKLFAIAVRFRDDAERELEKIKSTIGLEVSSKPGEYDLVRVNNETVKDTVLVNPEVEDASRDLIEKNFFVNILNKVLRSLDRKGSSSEWLSRLYLANYWVDKGTLSMRLRDEALERQSGLAQRDKFMEDHIKERLEKAQTPNDETS